MIKAVLFDVDGVLLDSFEANFKFYQNLFVKAGYAPPTEQEFSQLMHYTMENVIKRFTQASDEEVRRIWKIGEGSGKELYPQELLKMPKDAEITVQKLSVSYQLGIVTSRVKEHIYSIPSLAALEKYFQVTVGFEDTTSHKPHPDPLLFFCKKLKIKSEDAVYIGDAESDILAAKAAGMKFVLFAQDNSIHADNHIDSFEKLQEIIASL